MVFGVYIGLGILLYELCGVTCVITGSYLILCDKVILIVAIDRHSLHIILIIAIVSRSLHIINYCSSTYVFAESVQL